MTQKTILWILIFVSLVSFTPIVASATPLNPELQSESPPPLQAGAVSDPSPEPPSPEEGTPAARYFCRIVRTCNPYGCSWRRMCYYRPYYSENEDLF